MMTMILLLILLLGDFKGEWRGVRFQAFHWKDIWHLSLSFVIGQAIVIITVDWVTICSEFRMQGFNHMIWMMNHVTCLCLSIVNCEVKLAVYNQDEVESWLETGWCFPAEVKRLWFPQCTRTLLPDWGSCWWSRYLSNGWACGPCRPCAPTSP